ncbi:penicillin-binding transpeptidase domain-containing protein, partial [Amylibacter sp.]|nr:penicillin-binding transpeptidase domain-containing protein [Amylibacter sp.]
LSQTAADKAGGYFADWVLGSAPEFIIKDANADVIIKTTFDKDIQLAAEQSLDIVFQKLKPGSEVQAGIIVMSPDGAVRAMVGGRKTGLAGSFNRSTQALRQTGSAFKPMVYAAALENGFKYNNIVLDEPIFIEVPGGVYEPQNYSKTFDGSINLTKALAKSTNTVAIKISEEIGRSRVKAIANDFGIKSNIPLVPSMALGTAESTLLEITGAYAGILNKGISSIPYGLSSITIQGDSDSLLDHDMNTSLRVINENAANQLTFMMMQVIRSGTGIRADLGERQAAGKTGTTQGARDAWFIGFTADYVVGVWMGYDDNRKLTGVTGGGMPADIWRETMLRIHENIPLKNLIIDENKLINELETANGVEFINRIFKGLGHKAKKNSDNDFKSLLKNLFN